MDFREITAYELGNSQKMIGKDWMLITIEDKEKGKVNAMTASWGTMGVLWNKCVCICFIRPQRYTYGLAEEADRFSLAFFDGDAHKDALRLCGRESGRDMDKLGECGLHTEMLDGVSVISEADTVIVCRKLYVDDLKEECFLDDEALSHYEKKDFHRAYVCEIEKVYVKKINGVDYGTL